MISGAIEKNVMDFLNESLTISAYMEVPEQASGQYIVVEKTGSNSEDHIYRATIAIQSYADSLAAASAINEAVKGAMPGLIYARDVSKVELNSDYNFTNTATKKYRYQAVFDIYY